MDLTGHLLLSASRSRSFDNILCCARCTVYSMPMQYRRVSSNTQRSLRATRPHMNVPSNKVSKIVYIHGSQCSCSGDDTDSQTTPQIKDGSRRVTARSTFLRQAEAGAARDLCLNPISTHFYEVLRRPREPNHRSIAPNVLVKRLENGGEMTGLSLTGLHLA